MKYEGNPKHKEPWQPGRQGSLCPAELDIDTAQELLYASQLVGKKRFSVHKGRAFAAQEHRPEHWHGNPVAWMEVPQQLRATWLREGKVQRREIKRHWAEVR